MEITPCQNIEIMSHTLSIQLRPHQVLLELCLQLWIDQHLKMGMKRLIAWRCRAQTGTAR